jgi:hypothetical protein
LLSSQDTIIVHNRSLAGEVSKLALVPGNFRVGSYDTAYVLAGKFRLSGITRAEILSMGSPGNCYTIEIDKEPDRLPYLEVCLLEEAKNARAWVFLVKHSMHCNAQAAKNCSVIH